MFKKELKISFAHVFLKPRGLVLVGVIWGLILFSGICRAGECDSIIMSISEEYVVDTAFVWNIVEMESSFDPKQISECNAGAIMQITPETWRWICQDYPEMPWDFGEYSCAPENSVRNSQ